MDVNVDRELLLEFFLAFSKFEYALKTTGMFIRPNAGQNSSLRAEPDWKRFSASLQNTFNGNATIDLKRACEYLKDRPPNQQVIVDDAVEWEMPTRAVGESDIQFLLRMVRSVRNNLFHGGKHSVEVHEDTQRTEMLLRSSLTVLHACLAIVPQLESAYHDARL